MEGKLTYVIPFDLEESDREFETQYFNFARDLSALNRKEHHMTTKKGVPLNYHLRITLIRPYSDPTTVLSSATVKTAPQNWVHRNGSVKLHYAREQMFKNAGIRKSERGRYSSTIRYVWDDASQTWATPYFTDGTTTFTDFGEWDETTIAIDEDTDLKVALFGTPVDETSAVNAATFNVGNAYLHSRRKPDEDDADAGDVSSPHSIIRSLYNVEDAVDDEVQAIAESEQDIPPYDQDGNAGTFTSQVNNPPLMLGNLGGSLKETVDVVVPYGICEILFAKQEINGTNVNLSADLGFYVEVLGTSEMQG